MSITKEEKKELILKFKQNEKDTGSVEVQVSLLTKRINSITSHLKTHKKDYAGRKGLLILVGRRRYMLVYLKKKDEKRYEKLIADLKIRKIL